MIVRQRGSYGVQIGGAKHTLDPIFGGAEPSILPPLLIKGQIIGGAAAPAAPPYNALTDLLALFRKGQASHISKEHPGF